MKSSFHPLRSLTVVGGLWATLAMLCASGTAHAHFLWAHIETPDKLTVTFAEGASGVTEDVPVEKLNAARAWVAGATPVTLQTQGAGRGATLPAGAKVAGAAQTWGVLDKREAGRGLFLLEYGAKAAASAGDAGQAANLPLELFARLGQDGKQAIVVLRHNGKAVPQAALTVHDPQDEKGHKVAADAQGEAVISLAKPGIYGIRAAVAEQTPGELEGKKYDLVRRYATLTFRVPAAVETRAAAQLVPTATGTLPEGNAKADPAAYALLKGAHDSRQVMPENFAGFSADIAFYDDNQSLTGKIVYNRKGKTEIKIDNGSEAQQKWVTEKLMNLIGHRRGGSFAEGDGKNPLTFGSTDTENAFGKLIELNDRMKSSYRVRGNKVTEVTRTAGGTRFTISVLETIETAPGKYLANHFVVAYRDAATSALKMFEGYHDSYSEFNGVWLPTERNVIELDEKTTPKMRSIRLKNITALKE